MSSDDIVINVRNLSKRYEIYNQPRDRLKQLVLPRLYHLSRRTGGALGIKLAHYEKQYFREFWALQDISFQVKKGETLGIIGRNGSGKSTLLQILAGTLAQTTGDVSVKGRIAALLELGSGFNPEFSGRQNVFMNGQILGLSQKEIEARYDQIVAFADIGEFIDQPVKTYSSGMFVRLAFAVQAHIDASIVIIDEALAVGDVFFRQKCYARLEELRKSGAAILLVTHAMTEVEQYCSRALLLRKGQQVFLGKAAEATKHYYLQNQSVDIDRTIPEDTTAKQIQHEQITTAISENGFWPPDDAFRSAAHLTQVSSGRGKCLRFAVCDEMGNPRDNFAQSETAVFYYEFLLNDPIAVPLGGIVLQNERGINVHGKGSLEYYVSTPSFLPANTIIKCRQAIKLNLELGEYTYELGLASIDAESYAAMPHLSHQDLYSRIFRVCHAPQAGVIAIGSRKLGEGSPTTHHGIADLPGKFEFNFVTQPKT
jgi:lipopolysaccharide transport system ATP-binding protein